MTIRPTSVASRLIEYLEKEPDNGLYYSVVETYLDGTELIEVYLWLSHFEEGITVDCEAFVAGVMLDDGSTRRTYTADDFDVRGNKTYEGGGTYPVTYAYDAFNVMTNMTTFRDCSVPDASASGDATAWLYDEATGLLLSKTYADGHGPTYTYTDSGNLATRTWARGVVTYYVYDGWNRLLSCNYSDSTPSVIFVYDAMGRQQAVADAVGVTSFSYDAFGDPSGEAVTGLYSKSMTRHRDAYGRDLGYTLDGSRKNIIEYEADTGRMKRVMFAGAWYTYSYLPGTDLKSSLTVGTAGRTDWTYEPRRDLLTQVKNTAFGNVVSQYDYVNDAIGRRTEISRSGSRMTESRTDAYGYNDRNELTNAAKNATFNEYAYQYDDIGNRLTSLDLGTNRTYVANSLNQYTLVGRVVPNAPQEEFAPQFDLDGNQALVKTSTGVWSVTYNGENRPVMWSCGATNITMKYDRMGRRVEYLETVTDSTGGPQSLAAVVTNAHHRFVYDGYLCVQRLNASANNAVDLAFGWDPTEPVATRPLWMQRVSGSYNFFYFHDGNKNVSDLVSYQSARGVPAHYEYAPFGVVTAATTNIAFTAFKVADTNPYRFSSEYADDTLGLVYYNYRHYNPLDGRWTSRDDYAVLNNRINIYAMVMNRTVYFCDYLGMSWYNPFSWDYGAIGKNIIPIGEVTMDVVKSTSHMVGNGICSATKYTYKYTVEVPIEWCIGENYGEFWRRDIWGLWSQGPTGGYMPKSIREGMLGVRQNLPNSAPNNGMHAWHAGSNAYLVHELGVIGVPLILVGGLVHEMPLDYRSFCDEENNQGSINHALDSITDIVANVLGVSLGSLGIDPRTAAEIGDWIPGPGEPDPAFNHGKVVPNYQQTGNPSGAWGYGPSTR